MKPKKLLSFLLATAMTISLLPTFTLTASAATTTEKNITLGTSALKGGQASNVYFGNYQQLSLGNAKPTTGTEGVDWIKSSTADKNKQGPYYSKDPIKWRVLSNADGKAFLLSDKNLDAVCFHDDYETVTWATSTIRSWLNGYDAASNIGGNDGKDYTRDNFIGSAFSENEKKGIVSTTVEENIQDKVFLLSAAEAENTSYFADDNSRKAVNTAYVYGGGKNGQNHLNGIDEVDKWWLRSIFSDITASFVSLNGTISSFASVSSKNYSARPAFNLNPASVLFTSAKGVKAIDEGNIKKNENYEPGTGEKYEYKLTMKDDDREFTVTETSAKGTKGESITLNYDKAQTGTNEYISAMIVKNSEVLYYGQGEKTEVSTNDDTPVTEKGKVKFTLPDEIEIGEYTLYVFNEQINGDKKTDFSSAFQTVSLNVLLSKATFTTAPAAKTNLTYDGTEQELVTAGVTSNGIVKYSLSENGTYSEDIPKGKNADTYTVWYYIEGDSSYSDSEKASVKVTIAKADSQTTTTADATVTYGETLTLTATVTKAARTLDKVDFYVVEGDNAVLLETADVTYTDGTHGTATLEVDTTDKKLKIGSNTIVADYGGSVNLNDSESDTITVTLNQKEVGLTWSGYDNLVYDGNSKNVTATATGIESGDGVIGVTVTGGTETNAGNHTARATALTETYAEYYKLPTDNTKDYTISPKTVTATIGDIADQIYTGSEIKPQITVYDDDETTVIPASEYTVGYSNNINAGTATVTLTDNAGGNYTVRGSKDFIIARKSIENATLALDGELTYNGQPQTQNVTFTLDGFTNVTFDVSDNEQTDVKTDGDYTLTVTGTGNFEGEKTLDWNIKPYTPTENPEKKTTARVRRGRTLADAEVTNGEILGLNDTAIEGTFAWVDGTKTVDADTAEQMTFTPSNTNYAPITVGVAVSAYSSGGGSSSSTSRYTVKFDTDGGNTITSQTVTKNSKATEPTAPTKEGYIFDGWYTDSKFTTKYDFDTKVTKNITLYAKWVEDEVQEPSDDKKDDEQKPITDEWKNPFTDVNETDWFFNNVKYANENGLMSGVTNTEFAPDETLTRGMLVTILYRLAGEPAVNKSIPFADVTADSYYANAVIWAEQNGIVKGVTETEFAPDENITREQIAVILYRYAKAVGYDMSVGEDTNILSYTDFDEISEYAIEAIQYAVGMGLIKGKTESTLNPKDNATRAEIAAILQRFIEGNK